MKNVLVFVTMAAFIIPVIGIKECIAVEGDIDPAADLECINLVPNPINHAPATRDTIEVIIGSPVIGNVIPFWGASYNASRFQVLFLQSEINIAGDIISFAFMPTTSTIGTYNDVRMYCCHTNVPQLSSVFDDNYAGNTPVEVMNEPVLAVGGTANEWMPWDINFSYNNVDNLLVEIRWNGDNNINVPFWRTGEAIPRRLYAWDDNATTGSLQNTSNYVRLIIVTTGIEEETSVRDHRILLGQNIPNPFSKLTKINFDIGHSTKDAELKIYDVTGRVVKSFDFSSSYAPRPTYISWDGKDEKGSYVENGVYFYRLETDECTMTKSMIYLR